MEIHELLQGIQIDHSKLPSLRGIRQPMLLHHFAGALNRAGHARLADEHVVRLFREHEAAGTRERIETRLGQRGKLELSITVSKESKHKERQPMSRLLVECGEDAVFLNINIIERVGEKKL